jgi:uncharacterized membrane protein
MLADVALYAVAVVGALLAFVLALHVYASWTLRKIDQAKDTSASG